MDQETRARQSLSGELGQEKLARSTLTRELDQMSKNISRECILIYHMTEDNHRLTRINGERLQKYRQFLVANIN